MNVHKCHPVGDAVSLAVRPYPDVQSLQREVLRNHSPPSGHSRLTRAPGQPRQTPGDSWSASERREGRVYISHEAPSWTAVPPRTTAIGVVAGSHVGGGQVFRANTEHIQSTRPLTGTWRWGRLSREVSNSFNSKHESVLFLPGTTSNHDQVSPALLAPWPGPTGFWWLSVITAVSPVPVPPSVGLRALPLSPSAPGQAPGPWWGGARVWSASCPPPRALPPGAGREEAWTGRGESDVFIHAQ